MAGTTINGLNAVTSLTAQDEVPVWDKEASGEPTKKITAQNMAASVKTLGSLVNTTEMNNALAGKQNTLTFDTTPTTGSTNPVTSGGIADAITQSTASIEYYELLIFSGTSEATVSFGRTASDYDLVNFILLDSNGVRVAAAMTTVIQAHNVTFKLYGESSSQWGSIRISDDYTKATCNRTSSNTSQLRVIGIKYR